MDELRLFMILIGCTPSGRHTEQHDVFFGIARNLKELVPQMIAFWPEAEGKIHIDSWRQVTVVDGQAINVLPRSLAKESPASEKNAKLFFLNLGGYKPNDFEEYHYKMLAACSDISSAIALAKKTAFYKHTGFTNAASHIDDKFGIDIDDVYPVEDILPPGVREQYAIVITPGAEQIADELHIGYFKLSKI